MLFKIGQVSDVLKTQGAQLLLPVALLHGAAFAIGYWISKLSFGESTSRTISIECGMQVLIITSCQFLPLFFPHTFSTWFISQSSVFCFSFFLFPLKLKLNYNATLWLRLQDMVGMVDSLSVHFIGGSLSAQKQCLEIFLDHLIFETVFWIFS